MTEGSSLCTEPNLLIRIVIRMKIRCEHGLRRGQRELFHSNYPVVVQMKSEHL